MSFHNKALLSVYFADSWRRRGSLQNWFILSSFYFI